MWTKVSSCPKCGAPIYVAYCLAWGYSSVTAIYLWLCPKGIDRCNNYNYSHKFFVMNETLQALRQMIDLGHDPTEVAHEVGLPLEVVLLFLASPLSPVGRELRQRGEDGT